MLFLLEYNFWVFCRLFSTLLLIIVFIFHTCSCFCDKELIWAPCALAHPWGSCPWRTPGPSWWPSPSRPRRPSGRTGSPGSPVLPQRSQPCLGRWSRHWRLTKNKMTFQVIRLSDCGILCGSLAWSADDYQQISLKLPTGVHCDLGEVPVEDLFATFDIGAGNGHLHVKPAGSYQSTESRNNYPPFTSIA